jgi:hypothetical protein
MKQLRSFLLTAALAMTGACALDAEPESVDELVDDEVIDDESTGGEESSAKPGCGPTPTHWCEPFVIYQEYPYPAGPYEPGFLGCINRADADLLTACQAVGGLGTGCCGGNQPTAGNHDHPWAEWSGGAWHCSGQMRYRRPCYPGSGIPECEPGCN